MCVECSGLIPTSGAAFFGICFAMSCPGSVVSPSDWSLPLHLCARNHCLHLSALTCSKHFVHLTLFPPSSQQTLCPEASNNLCSIGGIGCLHHLSFVGSASIAMVFANIALCCIICTWKQSLM